LAKSFIVFLKPSSTKPQAGKLIYCLVLYFHSFYYISFFVTGTLTYLFTYLPTYLLTQLLSNVIYCAL